MAGVPPVAELRGRAREQEVLDRLLRDVRGGRSRVLVVRGEAGVGKTALLRYAAEGAGVGRVVWSAGVETQSEMAYSALGQVCGPLLGHLERLPGPQRGALGTALGLGGGEPAGPLLIGLGVLGLLAEAAGGEPLVCVVDDVQWIDGLSAAILGFVARRLDAESVALVFAVRTPALPSVAASANERFLAGLPALGVEGLGDEDARALLDSVLTGPVDPRVRERILAQTRGNPLALLELPRGLPPAEPAHGAVAVGHATPAAGGHREEFRRRIAALPADTRRLLLAAAMEQAGEGTLLWRALQRLGIGPQAARPAHIEDLVDISVRVRFHHPLAHSAVWDTADTAILREVQQAFTEAIDDAGRDVPGAAPGHPDPPARGCERL